MNATDTPILHEQFEAQVRRSPNAPAVHFEGASMTFTELDARANGVAEGLASSGVASGFVGLHVERSIDYVAAALGILKAGCAVVPLPPSYPEQRLAEILAFARLDAVITTDDRELDPSLAPRTINLLRIAPRETAPQVPVRPDAPAYVLSSSGSTGRPKMIVRSHASFAHRLRWTWREHPYDDGEVCVQKSHMTTTHAIYELFEPLLRGVPVHVLSDEVTRDLASFWAYLRQHAISRLLIVASMLQASLDLPSFAPPALRVVVLMGEAVGPALAARALEAFPAPARVFSIYGSTEASSTLVCDLRASLQPGRALPLGTPITQDIRALVLDETMAPVRAGETGMLHIGGSALFSGYFRDPDLTSAALLDWNGDRLYRTQDSVRLTDDGSLEFVGRVDDMVKVRGFRVDLRDVERAILAHPDVRQGAVLPVGDAAAASLVAFVTPASVRARDVIAHARETLPAYMIPAAVVSLDALPLTASGKLDRRKLIADFTAQHETSADFATPTERIVAEVWRQVLGHGRFERDSSFFEIGGTSLNFFTAVHRLRERFALDRSALADLSLYRHPTLADLAAFIDAVRSGGASVESSADEILVTLKRGREDAPPLFLISSAGGTLGAYSKVVQALRGNREIVGVRDPFLWNDRDPTLGFQAWVSRYLEAMLERQRSGPYYIAAYSSAGAFGYEIARQLRARGHEVALLALIDPLALDRADSRRFGYWALEARFRRRPVTWALRVLGHARRVLPTSRREPLTNDWRIPDDEFEPFAERTRNDGHHIRRIAALMELNTGLPFSLSADGVGDGSFLTRFLDRVREVAPETDLQMIERLVVQYELQVRAQHNYQLCPYDGEICLFEPSGPYVGLEAAQLRPYVRRLRTWSLPVGATSNGPSVLENVFPARIRGHYLCMRDDVFVGRLAAELDSLLR